jgi:maltose alpha-D-glucosyltransferase/alpha-amylase
MNTRPQTPSSSLESGVEIFSPGITRRRLEQEILPSYIGRTRWFGGKARQPESFTILSAPALANAKLLLVRIEYTKGGAETYLVPLQIAFEAEAQILLQSRPEAVAAQTGEGQILFDAIHDEAFRLALFSLVIEGGSLAGNSEIIGIPGHVPTDLTNSLPSRVLGVEQSNSAVAYGDRVFLKLYRRIEEGMNPDAEILRFLSDHGFTHAPPFYGALEFRIPDGGRHVLALALGMVPHEGDAWTFTLAEVRKFYERAFAEKFDATPFAERSHLDPSPPSQEVAALIGEDFLARVGQLGIRTAELHLALASEKEDPAFAPEEFAEKDRLALASAISEEGARVLKILAERRESFPVDLASSLDSLTGAAPLISEAASKVAAAYHLVTAKTRTHGDYHLGQVLNTGEDFVILDFEGEPARTLAERRLKRSPLRDVAGMLRSFHYAAHSVAADLVDQRTQAEPLGELWSALVSQTFLQAWLSKSAGSAFVQSAPTDLTQLLEAFLLEKALYEIAYELNNRPGWIGIPLRGILSLLHVN